MKWLVRLLSRKKKKKVPLPPKPYVDISSPGRHMVDPRLNDMTDLKNIDPEKPHWQDPRFDSRETVPFFDFFGFNRDWSWSLYKLACVLFVAIFYWEVRSMIMMKDNPIRATSTTNIAAAPEYSLDKEATKEELQAAGFSFVGVKNLDNLQVKISK
ncbi:hypothetical protein STCU_00513 [Strigomonas culicis]|uniref:Uncharacterized protein n=1 Tax=Strigomonas culicis TaxID=28005 RepID=S9V693_9TRYP|nr:hypothetical protein STCU_01232 [Strigomonas culicis]EPY36574.1 hypothetical protein STCU_00513 [Strigomonas culicis]|eukprot:EPY35136.1 hypothetical protein STCU_01232 [Strigomonas culicis]